MNAVMRINATLRLYVWCIVDTDSSNELALRKLSELDPINVRIKKQITHFQSWLGRKKALLSEALSKSEIARAHSLYLQETADQSRYLMSDAEESLAAELAPSGVLAWAKLHGMIWSQLVVPFERDGKIEQLPMPMIQNLALFDSNGDVRQRAAAAEVAAWATMREPLAAALNGVMGAKITLAKRRGRQDVLHATLDQSRIDRSVLDFLQKSIRDALPSFRSYLKTKAHTLGKESLPWWDIYAPVGKTNHRFTFTETQEFVTNSFDEFSPRMGEFARQAFEKHWIDAEPRSGKQGGAYCNSIFGTDITRILCNFDGSLQQVFTIPHELGHAFHANCQTGKTFQQSLTPMTLSESASLFCETLVTDYALMNVASSQEELAILNNFIVTALMNIVGTLSAYLFEQELFKRREQAELSANEICEISRQFDVEVFGEALDPDHNHPYAWAAIPHSFMPNISYYNFPYAFGLLFSLGLYAQYQQRGLAFVPDFVSLLASTGEVMPLELAARFGINLRKPEFWQASLGLIEKRIQRFQQLCSMAKEQ
jgi:oligoendopeptidase F